MRGKFLAVVCLLGLQFWIQDAAGVQLDTSGGRCRCRKVTTNTVPKNLIMKIEIIPPRVYCPMMEVVITTKTKQVVCVDPEAKWFKNILPRLMQMKQKKQEG